VGELLHVPAVEIPEEYGEAWAESLRNEALQESDFYQTWYISNIMRQHVVRMPQQETTGEDADNRQQKWEKLESEDLERYYQAAKKTDAFPPDFFNKTNERLFLTRHRLERSTNKLNATLNKFEQQIVIFQNK
jgi:hypothetical protein